ncbi:MAG TPA: hypothetical protein VH063_05750 [Gaiellaceae bacterium]|nr:hypothetical protein [Gaiellaceae bacterium]
MRDPVVEARRVERGTRARTTGTCAAGRAAGIAGFTMTGWTTTGRFDRAVASVAPRAGCAGPAIGADAAVSCPEVLWLDEEPEAAATGTRAAAGIAGEVDGAAAAVGVESRVAAEPSLGVAITGA